MGESASHTPWLRMASPKAASSEMNLRRFSSMMTLTLGFAL